jgi:Putative lumazine-binding
MSNTNDKELIKATIQHYIDGAISGKGDEMKPAFYKDATIYGYIGEDLFEGEIQKLFDWNDENGAATGLKANFASIDIEGTIATVRLELDDWTGHKFTDMFTLLKTDGEWKVMNKVFHLHD